MAKKIAVPEAKQAMENMKYEVANSLNVNLHRVITEASAARWLSA